MFKIESYITSIILANADRYIKNFRKQDAQVSLWEGDATFHNIDLNVDALNEELQSSFIFTSGYIHDLTIHVPWTKLMSEPVTIHVNTIECVVRLKTKEEKVVRPEKSSSEAQNAQEKRPEEISGQSSYVSALTNKIMNNLSIRCENVILKLVEEDIVFSMNIEKLILDNVNEDWIQTMTDVSMEKLLTRKLITLSGVTICLDKQNSSGRIDTYLEPLLYRCLIHIRLLRAYNRAFSKKPVYTCFDILSDKMSFTVSEPQIPMLFKLMVMIFYSNDSASSGHSRNPSMASDSISTKSETSYPYNESIGENVEMTSWGNWLWNMMPSLLSQDEDASPDPEANVFCTFHIGFRVKCLETSLKVLNNRSRKSSKTEFDNLLKGTFNCCIYQIVMRNSEWFNVQFGVNQVFLEIPQMECDEITNNQFFVAGTDNEVNFLKNTLFDGKSDFLSKSRHPEESLYDTSYDNVTNFDQLCGTNFSLESHLQLYTEHTLLEKTQAFAMDYLKTFQYSKTVPKETENDESQEDSDSVNDFLEPKSKNIEKNILLRFVFGPSLVKISSDMIERVTYLHKIIPFDEYSSLQSGNSVSAERECVSKRINSNHVTQFTFFDLTIEFHSTPSRSFLMNTRNESKFTDIPEISSPVLNLFCKCIDGKTAAVRKSSNIYDDVRNITSVKAVEVTCSVNKLNQTSVLMKCEKFEGEYVLNLTDGSKEFLVEKKNLVIISSKSDLLISYYIFYYLLSSVYNPEKKFYYYGRLFHSSLIEDSHISSNTALEVLADSVSFKYKNISATFNLNLTLGNCKAFANQLKENILKRVIVFSTADTGSNSVLSCMIQHSNKPDFPSCIWFKIGILKINLDVILYSWILYEPVSVVQEKVYTRTKPVKEPSVSKTPSRKISDCSSGSHGRRYSSNYPKPKESVHSSSEHEALSPPVATDTELSDVFQIPVSSPTVKEKLTWIEYLTANVDLWKTLIVYGEIYQITVYIPASNSTQTESQNMEFVIKESFKSGKESCKGVFVFSLKSVKIKCDVPVHILEELNSESLVAFSKIGWSSDKLTFPWTMSVSEMILNTLLEGCISKPLMKPLSASCTIGVTIRNGNSGESVIALCVHSDFQPILISLTEKQVDLIADGVEILKSYWHKRDGNSSKGNELVKLSKQQGEKSVSDQKPNRLTGWIQWTLTKFSIVLHNKHNTELKKLCMEFEDSIMSLEFDDIFHKMKLKVASFNIHHFTKHLKSDAWQNGPFHGVIMQRCYMQSSRVDKKNDDDGDDRFLLATITRAKSSNLKTKLQSKEPSEGGISLDRFVTEVILKICPLDVILPFLVIDTFLNVLKPVKKLLYSDFNERSVPLDGNIDCVPYVLPLVYLDVPMIRTFVPLSKCRKKREDLMDTVICEIGPVNVDCHPENPIIRKQLYPELYYSVSGKTYSSIEQKLQNQQYEVNISNISINTGIWQEIREMLEKEQLFVEEPPSAFEQNPAVMWNQGCHPDSKNKISLRHMSPIVSKFSCKALLAPPVESHSLKTVVHSAYYEINVLSNINATVSLYQMALLGLLQKEFAECILPYFDDLKKEKIAQKMNSKTDSIRSKLTDSGIESMDQSSVGSSSVIKAKSEPKTPHVHNTKLKMFYSAASSNVSGVNQQTGYTMRYENLKEIYITARNISFTFYKIGEVWENEEKKVVYDALMFAEIVQPYVMFNYENGFSSMQLSIFNLSFKLPDLRSTSNFSHLPNIRDFPQTVLYMEKTNFDQYSRIVFPCFKLKIALNANKLWKTDVSLEQPVILDCGINVCQYMQTTIASFSQEFEKRLEMFTYEKETRDQGIQTFEREDKFMDKYKKSFNVISNLNASTSGIVLVFKPDRRSRNMLFIVEGIEMKTKPLNTTINPTESITGQCCLKSICISLPEIRPATLCNVSTNHGHLPTIQDMFLNMVVKPWTVNLEILVVFQRWNLFHESPWTCLKIRAENLIFDFNPWHLHCLGNVVKEYEKWFRNLMPEREDVVERVVQHVAEETYKDDLRAGAFQYVKNEVERYELPSPYEVVFCNRRVLPYMCWRYPQPRRLTKLQIYPVPVEDMNEDYLEEEIRCQLQYYDEMKATFVSNVSFNLSENSIQTVNLPNEPNVIAAECWRIVLYDSDSRENLNNVKIDVRSLAGCVRVDSVFQPSSIPEQQISINLTEIQINLSTLIQSENVVVENYDVDYVPPRQNFVSASCNDLKVFVSRYNGNREKTVELSGICKASILNYEYLMFQSFIDPFFTEWSLYFAEDTTPTITGFSKTIRMRISPNFVHTLSVSWDLWNSWKPNLALSWRVTAPFVVCNNTKNFLVFRQENTTEEVYISPFKCHLYSWYSPTASKRIKITVFSQKKKYHAGAINIKKIGGNNVTCENEDKTEVSHLFVSVVKHSSLVNQVIIYGNLLVYNLTDSEMDMFVVSHGKRDCKMSSTQTIAETNVKKNKLISLLIPDLHKLSFKVCYNSTQDEEQCFWSGLIPLITVQHSTNQNSWMVKVPLGNHKEHFQSLWCQVTKEVVDNSLKYLVVFRPLCSITSFLPWKSHVEILNDVNATVSSTVLNDKGFPTEIFIPDTVSLDKYTIQWKPTKETKTCSKIFIEKTPKEKITGKEWSIHSLIEEITADTEDNKWPFLNSNSEFTWKTDQVYDIVPTIKVLRREQTGCGTKIEIYPWAIIVNMLSYKVLLDISDTIYSIDSYEIIAPPCIESTFKLGVVDGKDYLSGVLQLSDDQSFPIPKVTGRIPMNGFVTTMIECDAYVTFVNITSKNYKEMRVISMCSSYVISNRSSLEIDCAAMVVCRCGNRSTVSFDIPTNLDSMSMLLPAKQNAQTGLPVTKWYKIGKGDVQVLPYLILNINGNAGSPIRIYDLSEKQRYSVIFSCTDSSTKSPSIFITAQQNEGQVFLTIWDEKVPQIIIHNMSQLPLNITSSKSDRGNAEVAFCSDWNWKYTISEMCTGYFHIQPSVTENKKTVQYLKFAVKNSKTVKQTKWSCGVPLKPCVNQLITLQLSQHHIKLAIFRNGFTFVIWIESATSDELSAKMIRTRLSESFLPLSGGGVSAAVEMNTGFEDSNEIPAKLIDLYNNESVEPYDLNLFIEQISLTLAFDDDITSTEHEITSFSMEDIIMNLSTIQKPNEVSQDIRWVVDIGAYRLVNEQFQFRAFDFPVVLLSKSPERDGSTPSVRSLRDFSLEFPENDYSALKVVVVLNAKSLLNYELRDLELMVNSQDIFLEDKYLTKLKSVFEYMFSATCNVRFHIKTTKQMDALSKLLIWWKGRNEKDDLKVIPAAKSNSSSSKSVNVSQNNTDEKSCTSLNTTEASSQLEDVTQPVIMDYNPDDCEITPEGRNNENPNYVPIPENVIALASRIAKPLRLRTINISSFRATVSLHTSTTFYIALDRSPMNFSEFKKEYLVTTTFELGNLLIVHYFFGAIYGTGWAISSLEFVGSPGVLARTLGTGIKDFVSMPIYGIASGPRGFVLGVAHGSASLMKHVMEGTLSSVTKFAGSWARTLDRFTLDPDDLLQSEEIRRFPPSNVAEGVLQGLSEFGISVLGGISGLAHHPLQYAVSNTGNRSLINSISLGLVGVLTRPLSGAAELVARTGQGILSHVGWNTVPMIRNSSADRNFSHLQICCLKYLWKREEYDEILFTVEGVNAEKITVPLWITLSSSHLNITEILENGRKTEFLLKYHEFKDCELDPTLVVIYKPIFNLNDSEDFCKARIIKFINETNHSCNIENPYGVENASYVNGVEIVYRFYVNPRVKNFLLSMIAFIKNVSD